MNQVRATIGHHTFTFRRAEVELRLRDVLPEPLDDHFVVIGGRRYPPKQVVGTITGLDRADFNTHQARRVLGRLGFTVGRRGAGEHAISSGDTPRSERHSSEADALRPYIGQWVAQRGTDVLVAADTPEAVLGWLERHNQHADAMFRVPSNENEATGVAPL